MFIATAYSGNHPMSHMLTSFKLLRGSRTSTRYFALAAVAGVLVMLLVGLSALLAWVYRDGTSGMDSWFFSESQFQVFSGLASELSAPTRPSNALRLAVFLGAAVMLGLSYMHMHFLWWPVSSIGFVIASSELTNRVIWANFFIGWLVSTIIRRAGGLRLYRAVRPAFIGLVMANILTRPVLLLLGLLLGARV